MPLGLWSVSVALKISSQSNAQFHSITKHGIIWGVHLPTAGKTAFYKKKIGIMAGVRLGTPCTGIFKNERFCLFRVNSWFH